MGPSFSDHLRLIVGARKKKQWWSPSFSVSLVLLYSHSRLVRSNKDNKIIYLPYFYLMAFAYAAFFLLVICIYKPVSSQQNHSNLISLGSSISTNVQPTSWRSPSGTFAFGFYPQGSKTL